MDILSDILMYAAAVGAAYFTGLTALSVAENCSERITSQEDLERITSEEATALGVNSKRLIPFFWKKGTSEHKIFRGAGTIRNGYDVEADEFVSYEEVDEVTVMEMRLLNLCEGWGANRGAVRHELYHQKRHLPKSNNPLIRTMKWFYQEPAAVLYAVTGRQL